MISNHIGFEVVKVHPLQAQIRVLSDCLNKKIKDNNFIIDEDVVRLSQIVDRYIVEHEKMKLERKNSN